MGEERQVVLENIPNIIASYKLSRAVPKHAYYSEDITEKKKAKLLKHYDLSSISGEDWLFMIKDSERVNQWPAQIAELFLLITTKHIYASSSLVRECVNSIGLERSKKLMPYKDLIEWRVLGDCTFEYDTLYINGKAFACGVTKLFDTDRQKKLLDYSASLIRKVLSDSGLSNLSKKVVNKLPSPIDNIDGPNPFVNLPADKLCLISLYYWDEKFYSGEGFRNYESPRGDGTQDNHARFARFRKYADNLYHYYYNLAIYPDVQKRLHNFYISAEGLGIAYFLVNNRQILFSLPADFWADIDYIKALNKLIEVHSSGKRNFLSDIGKMDLCSYSQYLESGRSEKDRQKYESKSGRKERWLIASHKRVTKMEYIGGFLFLAILMFLWRSCAR